MKVEYWQQRDGEDNMEDKKDAVRIITNFREGGSAQDEQSSYGEESENYIAVSDSFRQKGRLNIEIQVQEGVHGEEGDENSAEEPVVWVQFFVGHTGEVLDRAP